MVRGCNVAGTEPTCTVVKQASSTTACSRALRAPRSRTERARSEPTVDATKHVNGGCRSLASDGREWECYIGQAAVDQKIIGESFLSEYAPSPGVG